MQSHLWYCEREGSSPAQLGPRRHMTKKVLSSAPHRKSSLRGPRPGFSSTTEEAVAATKAMMKQASRFQLSSGFFRPSRSRKNTAWLGSQVCHSSPSPGPPSAPAVLSPQLSVASPLSAQPIRFQPSTASAPWFFLLVFLKAYQFY